MSFSRVPRPVSRVKRTWKPTVPSPSFSPSSPAMRWATERAAIRRGWVWPISVPRRPKPSSSSILGIWVVLPEPVAPAITTTWCSRIAAWMSSRRWETGRSSG